MPALVHVAGTKIERHVEQRCVVCSLVLAHPGHMGFVEGNHILVYEGSHVDVTHMAAFPERFCTPEDGPPREEEDE